MEDRTDECYVTTEKVRWNGRCVSVDDVRSEYKVDMRLFV